MTSRVTSVRRDSDLDTLDRLLDDGRLLKDERRTIESMRAVLNEAFHPLSDDQRSFVAKIATLVEARPASERPSGAHLLDSLVRPSKPPMANVRTA